MKKLSIKKGVQCMACLECVRACSNAYYKEFHPDKAALKIVQRGENVRPMVCVQCGKCAEVCPSGAITQNPKGVWMISRKLCTGCGKCVEACPFGLIVKDEATPYSSKCTACGICVKACPMELLEIVEKNPKRRTRVRRFCIFYDIDFRKLAGWSSLRWPCLFRLAGKDRGEKGRLVTAWCVLRVRFRREPELQSLRTHQVTLRALWYAPPVTVHQV